MVQSVGGQDMGVSVPLSVGGQDTPVVETPRVAGQAGMVVFLTGSWLHGVGAAHSRGLQ